MNSLNIIYRFCLHTYTILLLGSNSLHFKIYFYSMLQDYAMDVVIDRYLMQIVFWQHMYIIWSFALGFKFFCHVRQYLICNDDYLVANCIIFKCLSYLSVLSHWFRVYTIVNYNITQTLFIWSTGHDIKLDQNLTLVVVSLHFYFFNVVVLATI